MRINAYPVIQRWEQGQGPVGRPGGRLRDWGKQEIQQGCLFLVLDLPEAAREALPSRVQIEVGLKRLEGVGDWRVPRLRLVKQHNAAEDLVLDPVTHVVGETMGILGMVGVLRVREERRPGWDSGPCSVLVVIIVLPPR